MKRAQRKANFKKLFQNTEQNSNDDNKTTERRETRSSKPSNTATAGLSKCVGKEKYDACSEKQTHKKITQVSPFTKRVNLTRFLFQDKKDIPPDVLKRDTSSDDFETPVKKVKCAPKLSQKQQPTENRLTKNTRKRQRTKQPSIKSALLRNEQMFSQIAAQHCIAENFNPEDIQMALMISRSEVETCNIDAVASVAVDKPIENNTVANEFEEKTGEDIRSKLQKYGFRTAAKGDYANCFAAAFLVGQRRGKTKWANKFTALTLRNSEEQTKKLNKKIEMMLAQQYPLIQTTSLPNELQYIDYKVRSQFLKNHSVIDPNEQFFRNIESLTLTDHFEKYFISELFPVTRLPADHLLKDWTSIPGRDISPQRRKLERLSAQEKKFESFYKELEHDFLKTDKIERINENDINVDTVVDITDQNKQNNLSDINSQPNEKKSKLELDDSVNVEVPPDYFNEQNQCINSLVINEPLDNYQSETELDGLLKVIAQQTTNGVEKTLQLSSPNILKENNNLNCSISAKQIKMSDSDNYRQDDFLIANAQTRSTSPDIFAESDSDCGDLVEENNLNNITTIENYSSEEVKTCLNAGNNKEELLSMKVYDTVDLTHDEHVEKIQSPALNLKCTENDTIQFNNCLENSFLETQNTAIKTVLDTQKEHFIMKAIGLEACDIVAEKCTQSSNANLNVEELNQSNEIVAIDLTQSDNEMSADDDDDDDCVVLSDDEINYSILKAKEIEEIKTTSCLNVANLSNVSVGSTTSSNSLNQCIINPNDFSVLEFVEEEASFCLNKNNSNDNLAGMLERKTSFNLNLSGDVEPIKSQYLSKAAQSPESILQIHDNFINQNYLSPTKLKLNATINQERETPHRADVFSTPERYKLTPSKSIDIKDLLKAQRAEFGILESQSEAFSQTPPLCQQTPNKITTPTTTKCDSPLNISDNFETIQTRFSEKINKLNASINQEWQTPFRAAFFSTPGHYKATPSKSINVNDLVKAQRAEFGILESQSEPFSQTPPLYRQTPNKITTPTTTKCDSPLNISDNFETLSRRSSEKNNKFTSFLYDTQKNANYNNNLSAQPIVDEDDFDEFDRLVYGSPPPKKVEGVPTGFSQLLTGEISLNISNEKVETFELKTPEKREEVTINEHVYYVRKTRSPKPNFEQHTEAEILKQLYEIGVKPLQRQQAIKLLEYIYNETHPIIEMEKSANSLQPQNSCNTLMPTESQAALVSTSPVNSQVSMQSEFHTKTTNSVPSKLTISKKFNFQDCFGNILLRFSHELSAELRNEDFYIFQTNITKKTLQPLLPLHIAWFNLVCSNMALHESILMYEPIDLQEVYLFFKSIGYRYDPKDLKNFFDQRCIIFRYDLTPPEKQKNRHTRKPKIKKPNSNKI